MLYLDEIADYLSEEWEIEVSISTVSRCLKDMNVSRKRTEPAHPERDEIVRCWWIAKMTEYSADQLVVVDESAADERNTIRHWGWSEKGTACRVTGYGRRSTRWSILPAITVDGYLQYHVHHGSINSVRFNQFVEQLLTKMDPFPAPRSVLVLDNATIHRSEELRLMCQQRGVRLEYLPAYSPDLSPIEKSFSCLKA